MFYTYVLYSSSHDRYYIGQSQDLEGRLQYHNARKVSSTKPYVPWKLHWYMEFETRSGAMERERKLKNLKSRKRVDEYIRKHGVYLSE